MDRFQDKQPWHRNAGAVGVASDGIAPGQVYTAVIQSGIVNGEVSITIPTLALSQVYKAKAQEWYSFNVGETALVIFDQVKQPWIISGPSSTTATAFIGYRNTSQKFPSAVFTLVKIDKTLKDPGGHWDPVNFCYVVPQEGYYHVDALIALSGSSVS